MKRLVLFIVFVGIFLSSCYWNVEKINQEAQKRFLEAGFEIVAKEGTQMGPTGGTVWYLIKKSGSSGNGLYNAALSYMFSGDLGLYNLKSIDAVELNNSKKE